jgi:hypothetical protein
MRVSMSAIGSVIVIATSPSAYQLDLVTPGISPVSASLRKSIRQRPNFRMKARGRPHSRHRLCCCTRNFGGLLDFRINDFLANVFPFPVLAGYPRLGSACRQPQLVWSRDCASWPAHQPCRCAGTARQAARAAGAPHDRCGQRSQSRPPAHAPCRSCRSRSRGR